MAAILEGGCRVTGIREGQPLVAGTLRIWRPIGRDTGARAISLRTLEFSKGESPELANRGCDEVLYVLEGEGAIAIDDRVYDIEPEMGLYLRPYQVISVRNPKPDPIVLISSQCPEPENGTKVIDSTADGLDQFLPASSGIPSGIAPSEFEHSEHPEADSDSTVLATGPSKTNAAPLVRLADRKALPTADRWYRVLVDEEVGCIQVTQFIGSIPPGRAPDHFHLYEEVLLILRGKGRMWAGASSAHIEAGSCIYLPKEQIHCVENLGAEELRLLGVFYPAGSPAVRYDADARTSN